MSGIFDRRAKRFISTEQAERAVPSRTVMASRVARDDVNRSERVQKKYENYKDTWDIIGIRDEYVCSECQYLGRTCDLCGGDF